MVLDTGTSSSASYASRYSLLRLKMVSAHSCPYCSYIGNRNKCFIPRIELTACGAGSFKYSRTVRSGRREAMSSTPEEINVRTVARTLQENRASLCEIKLSKSKLNQARFHACSSFDRKRDAAGTGYWVTGIGEYRMLNFTVFITAFIKMMTALAGSTKDQFERLASNWAFTWSSVSATTLSWRNSMYLG